MRNLTQPLSLALFLLVLLAGCAGAPEKPVAEVAAPAVDVAAIQRMADEGRVREAAKAYAGLAAQSASPQREAYLLAAAELWLQGNDVPQAAQTVHEIDEDRLDATLRIRLALLEAELALARREPEQAVTILDPLEARVGTRPPAVRARFHRLRALAFAQTGHYIEMARERVRLEPLLTSPEDILTNQRAIVTGLQTLSPEALDQLRTAPPPDVLSGWLELARMGQTAAMAGQNNLELARWHERYPRHPAQEPVITALLKARPRVAPMPNAIALILPLNNRFAKAAAAVRDGFFAAYYAQLAAAGGNPPSLRIYDEGDTPSDIQRIYQQAVDDGAGFVVGPLDKDAVNALARAEQLPVPVLALNYVEGAESSPANLFQISLSPEQEASQVAERAWQDGHRRAAVIFPDSEWGQRVTTAFKARWLELGGELAEGQRYDAKQNDYSQPIRALLNVDESEERFKAVRAALLPAGQKVEFTPRRRADIDFVFMAAFSRQARLIRPQLRFFHAAKVPVYSTSHAFDGVVDKEIDRDMDGVMFADMPWTLDVERPAGGLKAEITNLWPGDAKRYPRLYALGVDAYNLIGHLNGLRRNPADSFPGETGDLSLDAANRVQRRLVWSRFENGVPRPLPESR